MIDFTKCQALCVDTFPSLKKTKQSKTKTMCKLFREAKAKDRDKPKLQR